MFELDWHTHGQWRDGVYWNPPLRLRSSIELGQLYGMNHYKLLEFKVQNELLISICSYTLHPVLASPRKRFFWGTDLQIHFSPTMKSGSIMEKDYPSYSKSESDLCAVIICSCDSKYCSVRLKATESSFVDWLQILHYCCEYILAAWSTNMGVSWYAWCLHLWHPTNIWSILHSPKREQMSQVGCSPFGNGFNPSSWLIKK